MTDHFFGRWLANPPPGEEVVITGMSGRLPESNNIYEFRDHLFHKEDMVTDDGRRWLLDHPELPQRSGKIFDIDKFDSGYFGVHHRQADIMDPTIRIFLETAMEAVMDAGMNPSELEGSRTGVFVGICTSEMETETLSKITEPQMMGITGYLRSLISHRLSHFLKLKGPSYVADTACSSSFNALEHAFKAIRTGQCESAFVGGTNLLLHPGTTLQLCSLGLLNKEGRCKVFDQNADGYVKSESIACVFLQKAKDARRIYGQIVYSKINSDGFKSLGITYPSSQMQQQLMTEVFDDTGLDPSDLSFLEAHGTGTEVGDPEEVEAIDCAIARKRKKPLLVGSTKSNMGHSEPASGLCSLIKVIIAMETGRIAPNIHLNKTKEEMEGFEQGRLKVVTEITDLEGEEALVGINNFGFGGNNCHVMLRRFKKKKINEGLPDDDLPRLVCVSGRSEEAVLALLDDLNKKQITSEYVALFHNIFKKNIPNHLHRGYTIISKNGPLKTSMKFFDDKYFPLFVYFGKFDRHFKILGKRLLDFPVFEATMSKINKHLLPKNVNIIDIIMQSEIETRNNILGAVAVQIGIVDILKLLDLNPAAVYGDSWGKLVSDYYYERITLEEIVLSECKTIESHETISSINFEQNFTKEPSTAKICDRYFKKQNDNSLHYVEIPSEDILNYENSLDIPNDSIILNISEKSLNHKELLFVENEIVKFLETLGSLYEQGHNLHLRRLYPEIQFPVSRGTPMISPLIKWDHRKKWYTYKFESSILSDSLQRQFKFSYGNDEHKYIQGHVIDGRNLFPVTGYLNMVWETYIHSRGLQITEVPIVFEDCKFIRMVTMPKTDALILSVSIQQINGKFEVLESDSLVATGRIYTPKNVDLYTIDLSPLVLDEKDATLVLEEDEIYRELTIRGYNYSGLFKGLVKCNVEATAGLVKWENNWVTFLDKMFHIMTIHVDTRLFYVNTNLKKLVIEPAKLLAAVKNANECLISVHYHKKCNIIKCAGIEASGPRFKAISRKKYHLEPVLEKNEFVPNETELDLIESVTVNTQVIVENSLESKFTAVEILDHSMKRNSKLLLPLFKEVLENVPLVSSELTISTKTTLEKIPGVKVEDFTLKPESNLLLIVGNKVLQRSTLTPILSALSLNGFVLTREELDFVPRNIENIEILTQHVTEGEKLILFRKSGEFPNATFIKVSSNHLVWMSELKNSLQKKVNTVVYAQNQEIAGILGLVNCIRREPGGGKVRCFFMMDAAPKFDPQNIFYQDQMKKNLAINVYKNNTWGTYRHLRLEEIEEVESEHCFVNTTAKGDLSSLKWIQGPLKPKLSLAHGLTMVYCYYAAVNFKDVMLASGHMNVDVFTKNRIEQEYCLGSEFSGRDLNGRRVFGMTKSNALSSLVVAEENFVWTVPESWSLEDAATVPVVYSTVIYALMSSGNLLKPGTSVLIHSATGGTGIAALNVCLYYGCNIFVTVGTQEKRNYLKKHFPQIPDSHISSSRDTSFEKMIKMQTNGGGVDIVLNCLIDDKLKASIRCLTRGGKLLEIGKFNSAKNSSLNLLLMEEEISYHGIMSDRIFLQSSQKKNWLIYKLYEGIKLGYVKPLSRNVFKMNEVERAFRFMTTRKHVGKILLTVREEEKERIIKPSAVLFSGISRFHCDPEKSYIIVGGLGGVGMEVADWLMLRGAKKLILVTSSGLRTGYQTQRLSILKSYGVTVYISKNDVTTKRGCFDLIEEANGLGPIDGIFNLAAVLNDAPFEYQTEESFRIVLTPKSHTTQYLDEVTRELCPNLRYFIVFSSLACGRGNPGQSNYAMANSIMERICEKRKQDGFPALAIQWGAIGETGLASKMQKENKELIIAGSLQQRVSSCLEVLDKLLNQKHPIVGSMVVAKTLNKNFDGGSAVEAVTYILGIKDLKFINPDAFLTELGMDSITSSEILQLLEKDFDIYLTPNDVKNLTFAKLIELEADKNRKNKIERYNEHKIEKKSCLFLKYVPETNNLPIIELPNRGCGDGEAPTVFVFPGIEGVMTPLESLISNLTAHVFGLHYNYDEPGDSIEETAKTILPHIERNITKDKTFHLICYSFGAVVGLEVAFLLENKGYRGNFIAIDGAPTYICSALINYLDLEPETELEANWSLKLLSLFLPMEVLMENKEKFLKCSCDAEFINLAASLKPPNVTTKNLNKQDAIVLYKRFKSVIDYHYAHEKIKSPASLFKAKYPMVTATGEDYKLSEFFEQPVGVTVVEGDHVTLLQQTELEEAVNKLLRSDK